nr:zinc finger, CCHC-type [Tanacetum cinerariifolium]
MAKDEKHDDTSSSTTVQKLGNVSLQCPKLTETNYTRWALMMETILKAYGIRKMIIAKEGVTTNEKKENTSKAIIFQTLPQDVLMQVAQYSTAKEVWDSIKVKHLGANLVQKARLQTLRSELETLRIKPNEKVSDFGGKLSSIMATFKGLGETWKIRASTSQRTKDKSKLRCYECGEHGHFAKECTKWKDKKKDKEQEAHLIYDTNTETTLL